MKLTHLDKIDDHPKAMLSAELVRKRAMLKYRLPDAAAIIDATFDEEA